MKKKLLLHLTLLFIFIITSLPAQVNFVPNPSFEADNRAPVITTFNWNHYGDWIKDSLYTQPDNNLVVAANWFQPTGGTPDILNSDKSHLLGFKTKTARTGTGRMGIISGICKNGLVSWMFYQDTYSEYIECKLNQPLTEGKLYCVRYYVALDRKSNFASNQFGFAVTKEMVRSKSHAALSGYDPVAHINEATDHYITSDEGWVMICDTFIAIGGEQFLTLGSFSTEFPKRIHKVKKSQHTSLRVNPFNKFAYYYIDDVSLMEVQPDEVLCSAPRDSVTRNNIVFMLDVSGSMVQKGLLDAAKNSIIPLVNTIPPGDHITIITYNDNATVIADNITAGDTAQIRLALEKIKPGGGTNPVGGFNLAYAAIRKRMLPEGTNKIIVLTDGKIYLPKKEKEKIITASEEEKILLSVVFFGDEVPDDMEKFVEAAGGNANIAKDGDAADALRKEVPASITDTPYGERNAGRIIGWEVMTKIIGPALLVLIVMKGLRLTF
ncbi:MAG: VWA domain-containing protein [Bacteroidota bacterium]|nr:VWA domain-containing protein [Bacteroidota bacterium]